MINDKHADIISRIDAMRAQEEDTRCYDYFKSNACGDINEDCRKAMVKWVQHVQETLLLRPETVWIAMSYFDRYLSSGKGRSREVLKSRLQFQLAAITSFYMAVKIYEPVVLGLDLLMELCRGSYTESDVVSMEKDILVALGWRVAVHTPIDFVRHLLELLPGRGNSFISDCLVAACLRHMESAVSDLRLSCAKSSAIGVRCLVNSLAEADNIVPAQEKQEVWDQLSELFTCDLSTAELFDARLPIPSRNLFHKQSNTVSKLATLLRTHAIVADAEDPPSPICITQTARQA